MKKDKCIKSITFLVMGIVILLGLNYFLQPAWKDWNNYDTTHGFYEEPENTIETIFLGASITVNGITPMELYRDYGICAYNLGTEQQPMLASYYWMLEAERFHEDTLKTVVLDTSMLRRTPLDAFYQKSLDGMKLSKNKMQAVWDYTHDANEAVSYLFPLIEYHTRWSSFDISDFEKENYRVNKYVRGYNFATDKVIDSTEYNKISIAEFYSDENESDTEFDQQALYYLKKMIDYCRENHLKLVLMKAPCTSIWFEADHNAVKNIAEKYNIDFIDFNYEPYISAIEYNEAVDSIDGIHLNYIGATKLTDWFGRYLIEDCDNIDERENEKYSFLKQELEEYENYVTETISLKQSREVTEYLENALTNEENVVFITAKDEASSALSEKQKVFFDSIGLKKLTSIAYRDSYIGIIDGGSAVYEQIDRMNEHIEFEDSQTNELKDKIMVMNVNDLENISMESVAEKVEEWDSSTITYSYNIDKKSKAELISGGLYLGNISSCIINGTEYSKDQRGLNIVVYNKRAEQVLDSRTFDTFENATEDSWNLEEQLEEYLAAGIPYEQFSDELKNLYLYNKRCDAKRMAVDLKRVFSDATLQDYLSLYVDRENTTIYMSVAGDVATDMEKTAREELNKLNLHELSEVEYGDSYVGIICNGQVICEQRNHEDNPLSVMGVGFSVLSAGIEAGSYSSILINKSEYSLGNEGINVVIYDTELDKVINQAVFDISGNIMQIPENL